MWPAQLVPFGMALTDDELARRRPLWAAMSDLFLDTETRWAVPSVACRCAESGLDAATLDRVFWWEVFPLAIPNLLSIAGEWAVLELPERLLAKRAEAASRSTVLELASGHLVSSSWTAVGAVTARLRVEPRARWSDLRTALDALGRRYLEDLGAGHLTDLSAWLREARTGGVDLDEAWRFYEPILKAMLIGVEQREAGARAAEVLALLEAV